jgi:hypothetical protein
MSRPITAYDLPPAFRLANKELLGASAGILPLTEADVKAEMEPESNERGLQHRCEAILKERGYDRLTPINCAESRVGRAGWFGHLFEPRRNPVMSDLFIFDLRMRRCLMVELKVKDKYQIGQEEMIQRGAWKEARTAGEFDRILTEWEIEGGK